MSIKDTLRNKRLYKSDDNKMITGVCGGIAEYLGIDPTIVRLVWTILAAVGGSGILCYVIASLIIPERDDDDDDDDRGEQHEKYYYTSYKSYRGDR